VLQRTHWSVATHNQNPITHPNYIWRIKPPEVAQWRKDLAEKMKAGGVLEIKNPVCGWTKAFSGIGIVLDPTIVLTEGMYRIRPEPKPDVVKVFKLESHPFAGLRFTDITWLPNEVNVTQRIKVIWDSAGNLKDAEVLK
jgi:hypothetical protein